MSILIVDVCTEVAGEWQGTSECGIIFLHFVYRGISMELSRGEAVGEISFLFMLRPMTTYIFRRNEAVPGTGRHLLSSLLF